MPVTVTCTDCYRSFRVPDEFAGGRGRCPYCRTVLDVPGLPDAAALSEEAPEARRHTSDEATDHDGDWREEAPRSAWSRYRAGLSCIQAGCYIGIAMFLASLIFYVHQQGAPPARGDVVAGLLGIAVLLALIASVVVVIVGRSLSLSPPHPTVRGNARASFILTLVSAGFLGLALVALIAVEAAGGGRADRSTALLGGCGILIGIVAGLVAEMLYQISLLHVGKHFRDMRLRRWATVMIIATSLFLALLVVMVLVAGAIGAAGAGPGRARRDPDNPFGEAADAIQIVMSILPLVYLAAYAYTLQLGKNAIRFGRREQLEEVVPDYDNRDREEW
jgi:hypothetical protein